MTIYKAMSDFAISAGDFDTTSKLEGFALKTAERNQVLCTEFQVVTRTNLKGKTIRICCVAFSTKIGDAKVSSSFSVEV